MLVLISRLAIIDLDFLIHIMIFEEFDREFWVSNK